jgi:hypothetical protein
MGRVIFSVWLNNTAVRRLEVFASRRLDLDKRSIRVYETIERRFGCCTVRHVCSINRRGGKKAVNRGGQIWQLLVVVYMDALL